MTAVNYNGVTVEVGANTHTLTTLYKSGKKLVTKGSLEMCELYKRMGYDNNSRIIVSQIIEEIPSG